MGKAPFLIGLAYAEIIYFEVLKRKEEDRRHVCENGKCSTNIVMHCTFEVLSVTDEEDLYLFKM